MCNTTGLKGLEHWKPGTSTESDRLGAAAGSTQGNPAMAAVPGGQRPQSLGGGEVRNGENRGRLTVHCRQYELSPFKQGQSFASGQCCRSWAGMHRGATALPSWGNGWALPWCQRSEPTGQEMPCGLPNAFLERRLGLPSRVGCLYRRHGNWVGGMGRVRDVKPMCWKQDLTQMLGGREGGRVGGREGSRDWGGEHVYSIGAWVLFFIWFLFGFVLFFFERKKRCLISNVLM